MKKHYNITVTGRVQGIFFRGATRNIARYLNINGFVKNNSDGTVYIEAEGASENLSEFIKWCKKGHDYAIIDEIVVEKERFKNLKGFRVQY